MEKKKTIIYLHRYPIEYESVIYPPTRRIIDFLLKKYRVVWISFKTTTKIDKKLRKGIIIKELPYAIDRKDAKDKWLKMLIWYKNMPKIRKFIEEGDANFIVHKEQLPFIPSYLCRLNIPILVDIGDWWWTTLLCKYNLEKVSEKIENIEIKDWRRHKNLFLITHSKAEANMIAKRGMDINRITVVNHGAGNESYKAVDASSIRRKLKLTKDDWVIAVHGIIHPSKDYGLLLKWWAKISKEHENWNLLIIGGTIGEKWCKKEIERLNIQDSAIMTGWLKDTKELNMYLNTADCLLVTRKNNLANQGLIPSSLFHSLNIGKPLIITGLPGFLEIIQDKINGYSYIPDDYESFKSTLEHVYKNPKEAKKVGKNGIKRGIECFDQEKCARKYFELIDKMVK